MISVFDWSQYRGNLAWLPERTIYVSVHGSRAYGTATPESDTDIRGIAIAPIEYYLGMSLTFEQAVQNEPIDLTVFDLRKFLKLAADANPNALEILFTDPSDHLFVHPVMVQLLAARDAFLSTKALHTFSGYARAQFKRLNAHRRWLLNPPKAPPTRAEFGLPGCTVIPADQLDAAKARIEKLVDEWSWRELELVDNAARIAIQAEFTRRLVEITSWSEESAEDRTWNAAARASGYDANFVELLKLERAYTSKLREWQQYQSWLKNRNPARAALEAKYGMDCKHASHLVRLIRACRELLTEGVLRVRRPDADELIAIRNGAWTYEQLQEYADTQERELHELAKTSKLPKQPDRARIDVLSVDMITWFCR